jgi:dTDP-4-amino-4,6-dideoxygalactose transaminase
MEIAQRRGLKVIEDAAHALEAAWKGRRAGSIGDCGAFSFYATKNVTTAEGGMAVTADAALAERLRTLSLGGTSADAWKRFQADGPSHVQVVEAGYKYNMTDIQAALGLKQLEKVERYLERRDRLWRFYDEALAGLPLIRPAPTVSGCRHARHLYSLLVDTERTSLTRDALREELKKRRIGTGVHYIALHLHPFYQRQYGYRAGQFPNAEYLSDRTFSVPLSPRVTEADARDVVEALRDILA